MIVAVLVAYLAFLLVIGAWARGESHDMAGFYVAGKRLPAWVVAFSSNATGESGWLLLGLTGMGYAVGIHAFWVVLGEVAGVAAAWLWVARPFKRFTDRYDSITVPDFLEDRFRDDSQNLRRLSALIIFTMVAVYLGAQLTAAGKAFDSFLGIGYEWGVLLGAVVVLCYTTVGGFKAVAYSDLLQGLLMFGSLILLPVAAFAAAGGWVPVMEILGAQDPALLRPMGEHGLSLAGVLSAASLAGIGLAFLGVPQLLTRFISARSEATIPTAGLVAVICIIVFDTGAVLAGMAGRVLFPALADPETVMPLLSAELFPALVTGVLLVVVLAAVMSTADSLLILASSAVVRDVLQKIYRPHYEEDRLAFFGKVTTVILGLAALVVALMEARVLFWFVLFAWSGLAAAFIPPVLCGLFWRRTTRNGAIAGMLVGFVVTVSWVLFVKAAFYDLYEMIPGLAAGLLATVTVSLLDDPPPPDVLADWDEAHADLRHPLQSDSSPGRPRRPA